MAAQNGKSDVVRLLIEAGAQLDIQITVCAILSLSNAEYWFAKMTCSTMHRHTKGTANIEIYLNTGASKGSGKWYGSLRRMCVYKGAG